jgi:hypothetical protein
MPKRRHLRAAHVRLHTDSPKRTRSSSYGDVWALRIIRSAAVGTPLFSSCSFSLSSAASPSHQDKTGLSPTPPNQQPVSQASSLSVLPNRSTCVLRLPPPPVTRQSSPAPAASHSSLAALFQRQIAHREHCNKYSSRRPYVEHCLLECARIAGSLVPSTSEYLL